VPVVIIEMWAGRNDEQKAMLIRGITRTFEEIGVKAESVHVIIHDVPKDNWGMQGEQASKLPP
jgi:4-oxalocrotonate tautomerase